MEERYIEKKNHKKNEDEANERTEWKWEISWKYAYGNIVKRSKKKTCKMPKKIPTCW